MVIRHDHCEHLMIAYGVVLLRWEYTSRLQCNRVLVALSRQSLVARSIIRAFADVVVLLQDNASNSKAGGIRLNTNWSNRVEIHKYRTFMKTLPRSTENSFMARVDKKGLEKAAVIPSQLSCL